MVAVAGNAERVESGLLPAKEALHELLEEQNAPLRALYIMVFLEVGGFAMCVPVLTFFAIKELGMNPSQLGLVISCNAAAQLLGAWGCGRLSDSLGRRILLLAAFAWSCLGITGTVFVHSFHQLLLLRTLQGLSGGTTNLCQAYILDWVPGDKSPAYLALFGSSLGVAFVSGNVFGICLVMLDLERRTIFAIAGFFCFVATGYGCIYIKESLAPEKRRPLWPETPRGSDSDTLSERISDFDAIGSGLLCVWCFRLFQSLATATMFSMYAFFVSKMFGWSDLHFGAIMAASGLLYSVWVFAVYPLFGKRGKLGSAAALAVSSIAGGIVGMVLPVAGVIVHLMGLLVYTLSGALANPAVPALVGLFAGSRHLGFGNGIAVGCEKAAGIVGPVLGGVLYERSVVLMFSFGVFCYGIAAGASLGVALSQEVVEDSSEKKPIAEGEKA